jgi:phosphoribosylaminoimidazole-succinocarboxamide synthase
MENNFQGKEGETVPEMTDEVVDMISKKYIQLFELVTATKFVPEKVSEKDIEHFFNQ